MKIAITKNFFEETDDKCVEPKAAAASSDYYHLAYRVFSTETPTSTKYIAAEETRTEKNFVGVGVEITSNKQEALKQIFQVHGGSVSKTFQFTTADNVSFKIFFLRKFHQFLRAVLCL